MGTPKPPPLPNMPPPPPTPAQQPAPLGSSGGVKLGGTFLTQSMPGGPPLTKGKRSLFGQ